MEKKYFGTGNASMEKKYFVVTIYTVILNPEKMMGLIIEGFRIHAEWNETGCSSSSVEHF